MIATPEPRLPWTTPDQVRDALERERYVADRDLAVTLFLSLRLGKPVFLEGEAGVGKTEVAKVLASGLGRRLIRLQCYEGLDLASAVYEWDHARQILEIRLAEAEGRAAAARTPVSYTHLTLPTIYSV